MARINKLGTSYCSLGLEKEEEEAFKKFLAQQGWSAKRCIRYLIRTEILNKNKNERKR